ncbi:MAG: tail fiber domain-containing protein, partial [Candidatus Paceibacterota bacterium]
TRKFLIKNFKVLVFFLGFLILSAGVVYAFTGPGSQSPGSGSGAISVDGDNVGIGTASPSDGKLHVRKSSSGLLSGTHATHDGVIIEDGDYAYLNIWSPTAGAVWFSDDTYQRGGIQYIHGTDYMRFTTASTERVRIDSNGNVGIGTTGPNKKLDVIGSILTSDGTDAGAIYFRRDRDDCRIFASGHVLEMQCASGIQLDADSNGNGGGSGIQFLKTGTEIASIDLSGNMQIDGTLTAGSGSVIGTDIFAADDLGWYDIGTGSATVCYTNSSPYKIVRCSSSERFKENIDNLQMKGMETLMKLRPVEYNWIEENGGERDFGFIAEEVAEVNPLLAIYEKDEEGNERVLSVKYNHFTALITKAIQEQQATIESQQTKIEELEERIEALEGR